TEHQTKNPPVRRVTGANQHHGQKCTIAEITESRKNSYRGRLPGKKPPTQPTAASLLLSWSSEPRVEGSLEL
ncbi:hypothetical protein, partial [Mesorhizobium sp. M7A.F.Ca.CA.003.01.2.1]|uniref:hypothetical protein n=1 Tax=Mesorhizobium sp. M7A.F.Ca.CA.003.01.2.1 TaxID=2496722 RepID=UPI0019CF586A